MKKLLFLLLVAVAAMQVNAASVDRATAQAKASAYIKAQEGNNSLNAAPVRFVSERVVTNSANVTVPVYYIFNTDDRFIIVSGEDRGEQILAYGDAPLDFNNIPTNMQAWLEKYKHQIEYLQAHPGLVVKSFSQQQQSLNAPNRAQNVPAMLTAKWDQQNPYWNQCVFSGTQCLTGCPATSLAQVFYYWKYPTDPTPSIAGYTYQGLTIPALSSTTFDWNNMRTSYGWGDNATQRAAVATLMRYIGQAEHMDYGANGSGISSARTDLIATACKTFGYDSGTRAVYKQNSWGTTLISDAQWTSMIQDELMAGRPIVYCALSASSGHAFNIDGYTVSGSLYHINWGWSGSGNGNFAYGAFTDIEGDTYNDYPSMVIGIRPAGDPPVVTVDPSSLSFNAAVGKTVSQTFTINASNLRDDISLSLTGGSIYSISTTSISVAEAEAGATVTVTYSPTIMGSTTAEITISTLGCESITVPISGTAFIMPTLTATPNELNMTAAVNESATATFVLKGINLTGGASLTLSGDNVFSIDKTNILKNAVTNGATVTVTYHPTSAGEHHAIVTIKSNGAEDITVTLNGVAEVVKYAPVMQPVTESSITSSSFVANWTDQTYSGVVSNYTLEVYRQNSKLTATETGGADYRLITGIMNKSYMIQNLTAGATFLYRVKAVYTDGTESDWSNVETVTLLSASHGFNPGDVNHDGKVSINDVTALINYLMSSTGTACDICADVDNDGAVLIKDVTELISRLMNGSAGN